jgi:nucleotidyltransferase AbiEii toxin of type IV toxin-antitoxin system
MLSVPPFRVATPDERAYYESALYPLQDRILSVAATYGDELVLTGGTALARLYLKHRYSDDLDLFTLQGHAGTLGRDFANELLAAGFNVEPVTESVAFMRMRVGDGSHRIQVDVAPDSRRLEAPQPSALGVHAHVLRDIAANKIGAFEDRAEVKDAVDLYYLSRRFSWSQLFADAEAKRVPIAYDDLRHFLQTPLQGSALLSEPLEESDFLRFVATLRDEVGSEIKKKVAEYRQQLGEIAAGLLWDTPMELRSINERTRGVLARRAAQLPLPQRIVLLEALAA